MDDDDRRAELAELRRRVFGPDRDPRDAATSARLRELEEREGASPVGGTAMHEDDGPADASAPVPDTGNPAAADPRDDRSAVRRPRTRTRNRPRLAAAWAASLVIVAVAAAGGTAWWLGDARGTVAVLELEPPPVPDNATYLSVDTGSIAPGSLFAAFHGISVARIPVADPTTGVEATCLVVGPAEQDGEVSGVPGCATGAVPARTALVVTADQPQELRDAFPLGTTLVFELVGGESVRVRTVGG
ncbi:hypothetical protein EGX35_02075 [Clavibacter nebraskensis]|uniref:Uncharacterized protein n=1 Tax=Clavibacter nebraskensis TaxID=31963 RepID=A0ABY4MQ35_9MICO|nr:hypothetical protein [Clavibacter nebraskensis]KXU22055.1 hypothetical protein VV38_01725 [Clavibacter nebraskensis]OAH18687.1 hypothetical protein A3Q38_09515 [Clavibacter nebraskensis]QGV68532.1 hypothetical protein EGX37_02075 [Clavibacter nebraskensis]QGV71323.1 hypothetical protein EGX35_02075 [Clavibacter nebraskensis]UQB05385.1 hypothetical protein LIV34_000415 [Clavibacter nebraskensis]